MNKPAPTLDGLTAAWYGFIAGDELRFQHCLDCGRWRHPPRAACPGCRGSTWAWERSTGRGEVHSWTVSHQALHPAFADEIPYAIVIAALEEPGVRLVAGWAGAPPSALHLGLAVVVDRVVRDDGLAVPVLRPPP